MKHVAANGVFMEHVPKKDFVALYKRSLLCTGDSVGLLSTVQLVELS